MKKMVKSLVLVLLVVVFAAVSVAAEKKENGKKPAKKQPAAAKTAEKGDGLEKLLKKNPEIDTDKDGKVSKEEMAAFQKVMAEDKIKKMLKEHPEIDTDKDGKVSKEEMAAFQKANAKKPQDKDGQHKDEKAGRDIWTNPSPERVKMLLEKHPEADRNKDGKLDEKELEALKKVFMTKPLEGERAKKMLAEHPEMDANKDGKLTMGEVSQWHQAQNNSDKKEKPAAKNEGDAKKKPQAQNAKVPSEKRLASILKKNPDADTDKDGKLSVAEFEAFNKAKAPEKQASPKGKKEKGKKTE